MHVRTYVLYVDMKILTVLHTSYSDKKKGTVRRTTCVLKGTVSSTRQKKGVQCEEHRRLSTA
jgi:hypothetical protein